MSYHSLLLELQLLELLIKRLKQSAVLHAMMKAGSCSEVVALA